MPSLTLDLDPTTYAALQLIAGQEQLEIAAIVNDAIRRDLFRRQRAKKAVRTDERLVAPLRALLADDFAYASEWSDLQRRLRIKGYCLREAGGGLALVHVQSGEKIAKTSDLGYGYSQLMRRFDSPFPGHSHAYLFDRMR